MESSRLRSQEFQGTTGNQRQVRQKSIKFLKVPIDKIQESVKNYRIIKKIDMKLLNREHY